MTGQVETPPLTLQLATLLERDRSAALRERAGLHLLDWLGCAAAARRSDAAQAGAVLNDGSMAARAFYLGLLGNVLEMDDVDKQAILHPGPSIIPAALALCEADLALLERLPDAIIVGYEATIRLGRATGPGHYALWHTTGTCGAIGAAAACSHLLGLDTLATAHALALAMSQACGLWQTRHEPDSMGKQLHTAHAARAGLTAAQLAAAGFKGPLTILEGEQGFFAACAPGATPADLMRPYPSPWLIEDVSFKPWAACRHAHATIDAALLVREQLHEGAQIRQILVTTYPDALKFCDKPEPGTTIEAKFSLQHSTAVVLARGKPEIADFDPGAIADPELIGLRQLTRVEADEPYISNYPARYGASVSVQLADGSQIRCAAPDALGDPENPLTMDEIHAKARTLMAHGGVSADQAEGLIAGSRSPDAAFAALVNEVLG